MTPSNHRSRLSHFLEAYKPIDKEIIWRISDRVHRAGCSPDDPVSWQIAHDTIMEARLTAHAETHKKLPRRIAEALKTSFAEVQEEHTRALAAEKAMIAERVAKEAGEVLQASMPRLVRQFHWRVALQLIATFLLLAVLSAGTGYITGRSETSILQERYADVATQPDAQTWIALQKANDNLDKIISEKCRAGQEHHISSETSTRRACAIPLWLEGQSAPAPASLPGQAGEHLTSVRAETPFWVILLFGAFLGIGFIAVARRIYDWVYG